MVGKERTSRTPFFVVVGEGDWCFDQPRTYDTEEEAMEAEEDAVLEHGCTYYLYRCVAIAKVGPRNPRIRVTRLDTPPKPAKQKAGRS